MTDALELWERPEADEIYMIAGWRQWADAGSISSGLPRYLVKKLDARQIGVIRPDGFYLFQIPGTHDLVRPIVKFDEGYPQALETQRNELYYAGDGQRGMVILLGDEPHMDAERYVSAVLELARSLGVKRIIGLGGVYGEMPYDKERFISSIYSLPYLREELEGLAVNLSDYQGGASIGSFVCRRSGEHELEYIAFYAFSPTYDFSNVSQISNMIRVENDFTAWLGVMRRINYMLKFDFDLSDLERKSRRLVKVLDAKVAELEELAPQVGVRDYMDRLSDEFTEVQFDPLSEVWEEEISRLFDDLDRDGT